MKLRSLLLVAAIGLMLLTSCSEYQQVLKNNDLTEMYELANRYYQEEEFVKAKRLYELIAPKYAGRPQGERLSFFFADAQFKTKAYYLSSYQFERFIKAYPNSDKREEASFLEAESYYHMSPRFSLDQTDTDKALEKLQNFINNYPNSEYFNRANERVQELKIKKERKAFEIAKQYDNLGEFNLPVLFSAIKSLNNFIIEYPGSIFREEALFIRIKSATVLAENSTSNRMMERYEEALDYYKDFRRYYERSKFDKEVEYYYSKIQSGLEFVNSLN
ncbi:MAG: outer membrane protein assembly factor BamD [Flavobacteriaceae bacterium]